MADAAPSRSSENPIRLDWFMVDTATVQAGMSEADINVLRNEAERFILSGLSWERWAMLSAESRDAFASAGAAIRERFAYQVGEAVARAIDAASAVKE